MTQASRQEMDRLESAARDLEASGLYRILRRLDVPMIDPAQVPSGAGRALIVDSETTGLDTKADRLIELGMVLLAYDRATGAIHGVLDIAGGFDDPGIPIPREITEITGITDEMVHGQKLDLDRYRELVLAADIVIAHHAAFDHPMISRHLPELADKPWACSFTGIDWSTEGYKASKLDYLLSQFGAFHNGHRATDDCKALAYILTRTLRSGSSALSRLLESARRETWRLWATNSPFSLKDELKKRSFEWCNGDGGRPKSWYRDVTLEEAIDEIAWLRGQGRPLSSIMATRLDAWNRFTDERWAAPSPVQSIAEFATALAPKPAPSEEIRPAAEPAMSLG